MNLKAEIEKERIAVEEILRNALTIRAQIAAHSRRSLIADKAAFREVRIRLRTIRHATRKIPQSFKLRHSEIHWENLRKIHTLFFHEYFGIDVDEIWLILSETIPAIVGDMQLLLDDQNSSTHSLNHSSTL